MILISDYDGTLFQGDITDADIQAIDTFRKRGHLFGIATGRSLHSLSNVIQPYNVKTDFIIGTNGGIVQHEDVTIFSKINSEIVLQLFYFSKGYADTRFMVSDGFQHFHFVEGRANSAIYNSVHLKNNTPEVNKKIYQDLVKSDFKGLDFFYNNHNGGIIDIVQKEVSKSNAIYRLCIEQLNYSKSEIFVIGNSLNDIGMVRDFNGFAVSDSDSELFKYASKIFPNVAACIEFLI